MENVKELQEKFIDGYIKTLNGDIDNRQNRIDELRHELQMRENELSILTDIRRAIESCDQRAHEKGSIELDKLKAEPARKRPV